MKCPGKRSYPRTWAIIDDEDTATTYITINPMKNSRKYAAVPAVPIMGFSGVSFTDIVPESAIRLICPLQNDEAYEVVERAVVESAVMCGFYPDTMGPFLTKAKEEGG